MATKKPKPAPATKLSKVDLSKIDSPTLRRLVEEVRIQEHMNWGGYDRCHNRHNRS